MAIEDVQTYMESTSFALNRETEPFWRRENIPGLMSFIQEVFPGTEDMAGLKAMVEKTIDKLDRKHLTVCSKHGTYWVYNRDRIRGKVACPKCE